MNIGNTKIITSDANETPHSKRSLVSHPVKILPMLSMLRPSKKLSPVAVSP
jgi:hypothetical protein